MPAITATILYPAQLSEQLHFFPFLHSHLSKFKEGVSLSGFDERWTLQSFYFIWVILSTRKDYWPQALSLIFGLRYFTALKVFKEKCEGQSLNWLLFVFSESRLNFKVFLHFLSSIWSWGAISFLLMQDPKYLNSLFFLFLLINGQFFSEHFSL